MSSEFERVQSIVSQVSFPGYKFVVEEKLFEEKDFFVYLLHVQYDEPDVYTGTSETQKGRDWLFPEGWTAGQIVQTCFKALLTSLEHRAREHFCYRGKPILMPHMDVDALWGLLPERPSHAPDALFS